jgi:hypothetical protein
MKSLVMILGLVTLIAIVSTPARLHGSQTPEQHDQHHPDAAAPPAQATGEPQAGMMMMMARMKATEQKLDELVKKMNAAKGPEKVEAIAELLTALVQSQRTMHESMMSGGMHGDATAPAAK